MNTDVSIDLVSTYDGSVPASDLVGLAVYNHRALISAPEPCCCPCHCHYLSGFSGSKRGSSTTPLTTPPSRTPTRTNLEILYTSQVQQPHQSLTFLSRPAHSSLLQVGEKTKAGATSMHQSCRRRRLRRDGSILPHHYAWSLHAAWAPRLFREGKSPVEVTCRKKSGSQGVLSMGRGCGFWANATRDFAPLPGKVLVRYVPFIEGQRGAERQAVTGEEVPRWPLVPRSSSRRSSRVSGCSGS